MSADALNRAIGDYDAVLPTVSDKLPASVFDAVMPRAPYSAISGVGYNHIDVKAAKDRGIVVTNTPVC